MAATPFQDLLDEAQCYACYSDASIADLLQLALMARTLTALDPAADTSPSALLVYAQCYLCLGIGLTDGMKLALLDQIAQASAA